MSGFTPFELQYGCQTPHILATLKSYCLDPASIPLNVTDFMLNLQYNLNTFLSATKDCVQTAHANNRESQTQDICRWVLQCCRKPLGLVQKL